MAASVAVASPLTFMHQSLSNQRQQQQQQRQVLVRFQSVTHVLYVTNNSSDNNNDDLNDHLDQLLQLWSARTGWPVQYLRIAKSSLTSLQQSCGMAGASSSCWWLEIEIRSSICGGKGGFGTLLKGQSRQAGAKLTTDFGACRDLQGRRLRHVNDEIKLRKWREAQERKKNKQQGGDDENNKDDDDYLWNTPSGLYNWHLLTPAWADLSKKTISRTQRHYKTYERQQQREKKTKAEKEKQLLEDSLQHYVKKSTSAVESIQESIGSAIQQGLQAKANATAQIKKRKRQEEMVQKQLQQNEVLDVNQQPSSLVTLSGEVIIVEPETQESSSNEASASTPPPVPPRLQIQSKSDFATAVLVLDQALSKAATAAAEQDKDMNSSSVLYYEIELVTGGLAQIGWASLVAAAPTTSEAGKASIPSSFGSVVFTPNNDLGDGVGDDAASFAFDGSRGKKFHAGKEEPYGASTSWKAGDVVGCQYDSSAGTISYSLNGQDLGVAFTVQQKPPLVLFPAVSCNDGETLTWYVRKEECLHFPAMATAVHELIVCPATETVVTSTSNEGDENKKKVAVQSNSIADKAAAAAAPATDRTRTSEVETTSKDVVQDKPKPIVVIIRPEPLDLEPFTSADALEELGMDRLKSALMAEQCKCGGTLSERATRLFSLKGLKRSDYPKKVRAKGFVA